MRPLVPINPHPPPPPPNYPLHSLDLRSKVSLALLPPQIPPFRLTKSGPHWPTDPISILHCNLWLLILIKPIHNKCND